MGILKFAPYIIGMKPENLPFMDGARLRLKDVASEAHLDRVIAQSAAFEEHYNQIRPDERALHQYDEWICSPQGQTALAHLGAAIMSMIDDYKPGEALAHDPRHMFKDLASSFHILAQEGYAHDWRSLLIFPGLMHDFGRLAESQVEDNPALARKTAAHHAQVSFEVFRDLLAHDDFKSIPQDLKHEMLYAVLVHQAGRGGDRTMAAMVQRSDREQGAGAENVVRVALYDLGIDGRAIKQPDFSQGFPANRQAGIEAGYLTGVLSFAAYLYPNAGSDGEARASALKAQSLAFVETASIGNGAATLTAASPPEAWRSDPFIAWTESLFESKGKPEVVAQARALREEGAAWLARTHTFTQTQCREMVFNVLSSPGTRLNESAREIIRARMDEMPLAGMRSLAAGFGMVQDWRHALDLRDHATLDSVSHNEELPGWQRDLAQYCGIKMGTAKPVHTPDLGLKGPQRLEKRPSSFLS